MGDSIDKVLQTRKPSEIQSETGADPNQFFSVLLGEGLSEHFIEIVMRDGNRLCFSYNDMIFFDYDPKGRISLEFGGHTVVIVGRGLHPKLFNSIKSKRVAWIKEADTEMQDHKDNETYIASIDIIFPDNAAEETSAKSE